MARASGRVERRFVDSPHGRALEGPTRTLPAVSDLPSAFSTVGALGRDARCARSTRTRFEGARQTQLSGRLYRRHLCAGEKRGRGVGKTKRGKGTKILAITDRAGVPVAVSTTSATPHEVTLVKVTLQELLVPEPPRCLIGDAAYDSDPLDAELATLGIELIAPHRSNRKRATQDGRPLRRYRRRWKVERLFAWLQNFRRLVVRYEFHQDNFLGMIHLGCILLLLRRL